MAKDTNVLDKLAIHQILTQSDILASRIKNMIVSEELPDGFTFPNENEFSKQLNVGRGTLREAYKILDTQGYIRRTKHGTRVRSRKDIAKDGNFVASLELADMDELGEFICALEPEAVYLAAQKMNEKDIEGLDTIRKECEEAVAEDDDKKLLDSNYRFHAYIREHVGNNLIVSALTAYYDYFHKEVVEQIYSGDMELSEFRQNSLEAHRQIVQAIRDHDPDTARAVEKKHLEADMAYHDFITARSSKAQ